MIWVENIQLLIKSCPTVVTSCARQGVYFGIVISAKILQNQANIPYVRETLTGPEPDPKAHRQTLPYVLGAGPAPGGEGHGEVQGAAWGQHLLPLEHGVEPVRRDAPLPLPEGLRREQGVSGLSLLGYTN